MALFTRKTKIQTCNKKVSCSVYNSSWVYFIKKISILHFLRTHSFSLSYSASQIGSSSRAFYFIQWDRYYTLQSATDLVIASTISLLILNHIYHEHIYYECYKPTHLAQSPTPRYLQRFSSENNLNNLPKYYILWLQSPSMNIITESTYIFCNHNAYKTSLVQNNNKFKWILLILPLSFLAAGIFFPLFYSTLPPSCY